RGTRRTGTSGCRAPLADRPTRSELAASTSFPGFNTAPSDLSTAAARRASTPLRSITVNIGRGMQETVLGKEPPLLQLAQVAQARDRMAARGHRQEAGIRQQAERSRPLAVLPQQQARAHEHDHPRSLAIDLPQPMARIQAQPRSNRVHLTRPT